MLKLLERTIATLDTRFVLVSPPGASMPESFWNASADPERHKRLVRGAQRLRGRVYLEDGAIQSDQLSADGLHQTREDDRSWHLLFTDGRDRVTACTWLLEHPVETSFEDLRVHQCPLAQSREWRPKVWYAVEWELARARAEGLAYTEIGGWAVARESRCSSEGLVLALAAYSLGRCLGGAIGVTTATVRHSSATILKRLGGVHLHAKDEEIPPYYDPRYGCTMEILTFDSRRPSHKYVSLIDLLHRKLTEVPVVMQNGFAGLPTLDPYRQTANRATA